MDTLRAVLRSILDAYGRNGEGDQHTGCRRQFVPSEDKARLRERDYTVLDMLNAASGDDVSFCVCDPSLPDCPIVFASDGFCRFTGYTFDEIEGRNCRFLQGPGTSSDDVDRIRRAIENGEEASVNLLNYKKDGTPFNNQFFLAPLRAATKSSKKDDDNHDIIYFIGCQCSVAKLGPGQAPANCAWVYAQGLHA